MSKPICTIVDMGPGVSYSAAKKFGKNGYGIAIVKEGTKFDPKYIADEYWRIHSQKGGTRLREIVFQ